MQKDEKKNLKSVLKNEVNPLIIGLRNEIKETNKRLDELNKTTLEKRDFHLQINGTEISTRDGYTPVRGKDYFTEADVDTFLKAATPIKGTDYFTVKESKDFLKKATPKKGVDYKDGKDGKMPIKGKDYFTKSEIKEFLKSVTPIKGIHYKDGIDGIGRDGADGTELDATDVRNLLESLKGSARLSMSAIKGLQEALSFASQPAGMGANQGGGSKSPLTTKGDLYTYDTADTRLPIGSDNQILIADHTKATGMKWGTLSNGLSYQGNWNANTNSPSLSSGVGTNGYYYIVSVAGTTTLDGISSWSVGDWVIFDGTVWQQIEQGEFELLANKDTSTSLGTSDTKYPSQKAVKTYVDNQASNYDAAGSAASAQSAAESYADGLITTAIKTRNLTYVLDGQGSVITTGKTRYITCPFAGTIVGWNISASGSSPTIQYDVFKIAAGTVLPSISIVASAPPALSTGNAKQSTTLTGWTVAVAANDIFGFTVSSVANALTATLEIIIQV